MGVHADLNASDPAVRAFQVRLKGRPVDGPPVPEEARVHLGRLDLTALKIHVQTFTGHTQDQAGQRMSLAGIA